MYLERREEQEEEEEEVDDKNNLTIEGLNKKIDSIFDGKIRDGDEIEKITDGDEIEEITEEIIETISKLLKKPKDTTVTPVPLVYYFNRA